MLKLDSEIFRRAESLNTLLGLCLSPRSAAGSLYGSIVIGLPSIFCDFQTSWSFIVAANWLTEGSWNFVSMVATLILSLILVLFNSLRSLFWVSCNSFMRLVVPSSLVILTLAHSWSPYLNLNEENSFCFMIVCQAI